MRLLDARTFELVDFSPDQIPRYAILSHTWGEGEVLFKDFERGAHIDRPAWSKIQIACRQALKNDLDYVWIDTCCIDKSSSAELSEAINSMYTWYREAEICITYLSDVSGTVEATKEESDFRNSRWFTRGWTLQELLAPQHLIFFAQDWTLLGDKQTLATVIRSTTAIESDFLLNLRSIHLASVAQRMSWAAHRKTTRPEDVAYCLLGIFSVAMPLLYGEGKDKAFLRLQEEILKQSYDDSLFAWTAPQAAPEDHYGLFSKSPSWFATSQPIIAHEVWRDLMPRSVVNQGVSLILDLQRVGRTPGLYLARLNCSIPSMDNDGRVLAIYVNNIFRQTNQFMRIKASKLDSVANDESLNSKTMFIRHSFYPDALEGRVFAEHVFRIDWIRNDNETWNSFSVPYVGVHYPPHSGFMNWNKGKRPIEGLRDLPVRFLVPKTANTLALALDLEHCSGNHLLILFGSAAPYHLGFCASVFEPTDYLYPEFVIEHYVRHLKIAHVSNQYEIHQTLITANLEVTIREKIKVIKVSLVAIPDQKWSTAFEKNRKGFTKEYKKSVKAVDNGPVKAETSLVGTKVRNLLNLS